MVIELESVKIAFQPLPTRLRLILVAYPALFFNLLHLGVFNGRQVSLPNAKGSRQKIIVQPKEMIWAEIMPLGRPGSPSEASNSSVKVLFPSH